MTGTLQIASANGTSIAPINSTDARLDSIEQAILALQQAISALQQALTALQQQASGNVAAGNTTLPNGTNPQ
jgi:prefoldin subunit 5